jgi:uncharacterized protein (DUF1330 family)
MSDNGIRVTMTSGANYVVRGNLGFLESKWRDAVIEFGSVLAVVDFYSGDTLVLNASRIESMRSVSFGA